MSESYGRLKKWDSCPNHMIQFYPVKEKRGVHIECIEQAIINLGFLPILYLVLISAWHTRGILFAISV